MKFYGAVILQYFVPLLLLVVLAFGLIIFPYSASLFTGAVVVASAAGIIGLIRMFIRPLTIRLSSTLSVSILLGYGLGSAIYLLAFHTTDATQYQYWSSYGLFFSQEGLSTALAAILLAAVMLYMRSWFEGASYSVSWISALDGPKSERLIWLGVAVVALALYAGDIGYMGARVGSGHVSSLGAVSTLILPPLVPYTLLVIFGKRSRAKRVILFIAIVFLVGILFMIGRRYLLYSLVLSSIAWSMCGGRFDARKMIVAFIFAGVSAVILYFGFVFFMSLRLAMNELGNNSNMLEAVHLALSHLSGSQVSVVQHELASNTASRPFILSYLAGLLGINNGSMPMYGGELLYSLKMSIPSIIMPSKVGQLPITPENLTHPLYGIPVFDGPNSIIVSGFDDFGVIGIILYPLAFVFLYFWYYKIVKALIGNTGIRFFVLFTLMFQLLFVEQSLAALFVTLRNLTVVVAVAWFVSILPALGGMRCRV